MTEASDTLAAQVSRVAQATADVEYIADVLGKVEAAERRAKELRAALKESLLAHVLAIGHDLVVGAMRYWAGYPKETVGNEGMEGDTLEALFTACHGDFDQVASCLRSQPFRVSACKALLPEAEYTRLFSIVERVALKEGKPVKQLCSIDERFRKQPAGALPAPSED